MKSYPRYPVDLYRLRVRLLPEAIGKNSPIPISVEAVYENPFGTAFKKRT